jgi:hypothetical protein
MLGNFEEMARKPVIASADLGVRHPNLSAIARGPVYPGINPG